MGKGIIADGTRPGAVIRSVCDRCGCTTFIEQTRAMGFLVKVIDGSGEVVDTDFSKLGQSAIPATVKCENCGKRLPNPHKKKVDDYEAMIKATETRGKSRRGIKSGLEKSLAKTRAKRDTGKSQKGIRARSRG